MATNDTQPLIAPNYEVMAEVLAWDDLRDGEVVAVDNTRWPMNRKPGPLATIRKGHYSEDGKHWYSPVFDFAAGGFFGPDAMRHLKVYRVGG